MSDGKSVLCFPGSFWRHCALAETRQAPSSAVGLQTYNSHSRPASSQENLNNKTADELSDTDFPASGSAPVDVNRGIPQQNEMVGIMPSSAQITTSKIVLRCGFCDATFITSEGLKKHTNSIHFKMYPFCCEICGKGMFANERYTDHMNMHKNIKAHKCPNCSKRFVFKSDVTRHLRNGVCTKHASST